MPDTHFSETAPKKKRFRFNSNGKPEDMSKRQWRAIRWEILKNKIEFYAILLAGCWAIHNYVVKELPDIDRSLKMAHEYKVDSFAKNRSEILVTIGLSNEGKRDIVVDSVKVYKWQFDKGIIARSNYFGIDTFINSRVGERPAAIYDSSRGISLIGTYAAGDESDWTFPFVTEPNANSAFIFFIDIIYHRNNSPFDQAYLWWKYKMSGDSSVYSLPAMSYSECITNFKTTNE